MPGSFLLVMCGNAMRREAFVIALSGAGWRDIVCAPSLSEAAGLLRYSPRTCAIIDADLEDVPGLTAVRILRNLCPEMKIIFTAPENTRDLETEARALGIFYYYINSADKDELVAAAKEAVGAPIQEGLRHRPKVLIVDDDRDFHDVIRTVLERDGYDIVSAYSEKEGLDLARREKPDAVVLDIIMETTTDGFEFCREARRDPCLKHTPILGVSTMENMIGVRAPAHVDSDIFPVDGYLRKPVSPERLCAELGRLVPTHPCRSGPDRKGNAQGGRCGNSGRSGEGRQSA